MNGSTLGTPEAPSNLAKDTNARQFAVMSTSGNTWRKLLYYLDLWAPHLDILLSIYDVYMTDRSIRDEILSCGIRQHLYMALRRTHTYLCSKTGSYVRYRKRVERILENPPPVSGLIALDSGGYSLSTAEKIRRLCTVKGAPEIVQLGKLLLELDRVEQDTNPPIDDYLSLAREAVRINICNQVRAGADIVVSLDRVFDFNLPSSRREMRWRFSLECARKALLTLQGLSSKTLRPPAAILPVIHPLGPSPSRKASPDDYYQHARDAIQYLERAERETGMRFFGIAVGSLVPLTSHQMLLPVAMGIGRAIVESSFKNRPIHAFGASNDKMELLWECGFNSFDTSHHLVKGRNRQSYIPALGSYVPSISLEDLPCRWLERKHNRGSAQRPCPVCANVTFDEYQEDSPGLKEVATVLQSLHDFYSNHLRRNKSLRLDRYGARL